jgi:hypothetical protein
LTILGDNNIGLVSIMGDEVIHRLLCPTGREVRIYTATMRMRPTPPRAHQQRPDANATGTA